MKRFLIMLIGFIMLAGVASAAPFLVCDAPNTVEQIKSYIVYRDGVQVGTSIAEPDGSLKMDLQSITPGVYTWTAVAVNVWGNAGLPSDPYVSPSGANAPQNIRMEP